MDVTNAQECVGGVQPSCSKSSDKAIGICNLSYTYPDGTCALDKVSLEVRAGERVAIIGANGAGKSTLLLHLNGVLLNSGSVQIGGVIVEKKNLKAIRQKVGLVFQNPDDQLFCPTVYDDVAFGPRYQRLPEEEVGRRVHASLHAVGLAGLEARSAFHMSFGEKKRVAIATVLSMECEILAFDEPTSNLDPRARRELIELLQRLGRTQLIVTHDLSMAADLCDRVVLFFRGRNVAEGKPQDILKDNSLLETHGL